MDAKHLIFRAPNYVQRFGWRHGLRLLTQVERRPLPEKPTLRAYQVPGWHAPVWLRETLSDHSIFWQCLARDQYNLNFAPHFERVCSFYESSVAAGQIPVIIDAGGNIGLAALSFARAFPKARVVTVEPDTANFEILRRNTATYGAQIVAVQGGVWPTDAALVVYNQEQGAAAVRVREAEPGEAGMVQAFSIDALRSMGGGGPLLIVKIDIEGAQSQLFSGNTAWVGDAHVILIEVEDYLFPWQGNTRTFIKTLADHPYEYLMSGDTLACFRDTQCLE